MTDEMERVVARVAARFRLTHQAINEALALLEKGETVPFITHYRKRETAGMKAPALRQLARQLLIDNHRMLRAEKKANAEKASSAPKKAPDDLMAKIEEDESILSHLRDKLYDDGAFSTKLLPTKKSKKKPQHLTRLSECVYENTPIQRISARKWHDILRGRREHALSLQLAFKENQYGETYLASRLPDVSFDAIKQCFEKQCFPALQVDVLERLRARSDDEMISALERQLQSILLTPKTPKQILMGFYAENRTTLGVAVMDECGEIKANFTLYPGAAGFPWHDAINYLAKQIATHQVSLIGVANGPHWPMIRQMLADFTARYPDMPVTTVPVEETALLRDLRAKEGARLIVKRLKNPLLQVVEVPVQKLYFDEVQDAVNPKRLALALTSIIEDVVNRIGLDVNTAPVTLLRYISGFDTALAKALVAHREAKGPFKTRADLKVLPGMDEKRFQQSAGFLRVMDGENPLDATRLHPDDYENHEQLGTLSEDIRRDIERFSAPWRDPRPPFKLPKFNQSITNITEINAGMVLDGMVHRMMSFGVLVDVGVDVLGLLHVSELGERSLRDPYALFRVGEPLSVTVREVDLKKRQIAFTLKSKEKPRRLLEMSEKKRKNEKVHKAPVRRNTAMADALAKLKRGTS